jgi:hypothetical protein
MSYLILEAQSAMIATNKKNRRTEISEFPMLAGTALRVHPQAALVDAL